MMMDPYAAFEEWIRYFFFSGGVPRPLVFVQTGPARGWDTLPLEG